MVDTSSLSRSVTRRSRPVASTHSGPVALLAAGLVVLLAGCVAPPPVVSWTQYLATLAAPVQTGPAGPDSPTSVNATLPDGRRVTPAGVSVQVGENPLNAALTPDGKYLVVTNDDERNVGAIVTTFSKDATNGAGKVPGGYTLAVVRTADMQVVSSIPAPKNTKPNPGPKMPGVSQSDDTAAFWLGVAVKASDTTPDSYTGYAAGGPSNLVSVYDLKADGTITLTTTIPVPVPADPTRPNFGMAAPGGLTLSGDGSTLYVVNNNANTVVTIDTASNKVVGTPMEVGFFPYAAVISPNGSKLYVSNWGVADRHFNSTYTSSYDPKTNTGAGSLNIGGVSGNLFANPQTDPARTSSVSVLNIGASSAPSMSISLARPIDGVYIVGGTHPSALAIVNGPSLTALYIADANEDQLAVVDARADRLVKKVTLPLPVPGLLEGRAFGLQPNALAVSPDNNRLYVAEALVDAGGRDPAL